MKVRAIKPGFYTRVQKPGSVFNLTDPKHFSEKWMEKVERAEAKESSALDAKKEASQPSEPISEDTLTSKDDEADDPGGVEVKPKQKSGRPKKSGTEGAE